MRRNAIQAEIPEISLAPPPASEPDRRSPARPWIGFGALAIALVMGAQLLGGDTSVTEATLAVALPDPAPVTTDAVPEAPLVATVLAGHFEWVEGEGLENFEAVAAPVEYGKGFLTVGNPAGVRASATVMASEDGRRWERIGTIEGVGGEVQIADIDVFQGRLLAVGTYTDTMPVSDAEPRRRYGAVWSSNDGAEWVMREIDSPSLPFAPAQLVAGREAAVISGTSDWGSALVAVYESLPEEIRAEVATGTLQLWPALAETLVAAGPIEVFEAEPPQPFDSTQRLFRSDDGVRWEEVDQPRSSHGFYSLFAGPDGELIATSEMLITHMSVDGVEWSAAVEFPLVGQVVPGPGRSLISFTGDLPSLRIWADGELRTIRLERQLVDGLVSLSANSEFIALLTNVWPETDFEAPPVKVGEFSLAYDYTSLTVLDAHGHEVGQWVTDGGLAPGTFDPERRAVVLTDKETEVVLPLAALAGFWNQESVAPEAKLAVSAEGTVWRSAPVPMAGDISLIGPVGDRFLLQSKTHPVANLGPAVDRYLLAVP